MQPLGLLAAGALRMWSEGARRPWGAKAFAGLICAVVLLNAVVCSLSYVGQGRRAKLPGTVPIESTGMSVDIAPVLENYRQAYAWAREPAHPRAVFVEAPQNNARRLFPLISQRMLYVSAFHLGYMLRQNPEYNDRWQTAELLFTLSTPKEEALARVARAAPEVYLLLESDALGADYTPLKEEFALLEQLSLAYDNPNVKIYRLEGEAEPSPG